MKLNSRMQVKFLVIIFLLLIFSKISVAQSESRDTLIVENFYLDSLFIQEIEQVPGEKPKVLHAEPLYIDLIRDLGARKGEKEWNFAVGMNAERNYNEYEALIEYEWAPIDRLGFEIEVPMTFYGPPATDESVIPSNRVESLKLATQWSFFVSEKASTTLALGYIHEFEIVDINKMGKENLYKGNIYNPFFIAAKRWGMNYHTLIYTGPRLIHEFNAPNKQIFEINTNLHYMITGTRNFIGLEVNKELMNGKLYTVMRPQMRVALAENLMVGIVSGIPFHSGSRGISSFARIIYEPGFRAMH